MDLTDIIARDPWILIPLVALLIPIVAIIMGGITSIAKMIIAHRERMAMIDRGIMPDKLTDEVKAEGEKDGEDDPSTYRAAAANSPQMPATSVR